MNYSHPPSFQLATCNSYEAAEKQRKSVGKISSLIYHFFTKLFYISSNYQSVYVYGGGGGGGAALLASLF